MDRTLLIGVGLVGLYLYSKQRATTPVAVVAPYQPTYQPAATPSIPYSRMIQPNPQPVVSPSYSPPIDSQIGSQIVDFLFHKTPVAPFTRIAEGFISAVTANKPTLAETGVLTVVTDTGTFFYDTKKNKCFGLDGYPRACPPDAIVGMTQASRDYLLTGGQ